MSTLNSGAVVFAKDDPGDAKNWPEKKKMLVVLQTVILSFAAGFGSPIFAPAELQLIARFHISEVVADSGLAFFVLGFSFGPLFCPMSEMYGRRLPYLIAWPLLAIFTIPTAFVNNVPVIIVFRFLSGCAAACAQNNPLGYYSDLFSPEQAEGRAKAMGLFAIAFCSGPMLAMPIGFAIVGEAGPEFWVLRIFFFLVVALLPVAFLLPETHGPTILAKRAKQLREEGVTNAHAAHEYGDITFREVLRSHIGRPMSMLYREPIALGSAIWVTLGSAINYLYFEIFPIVFLQQHNFPVKLAGLPFFSLVIGFLIAIVLVPILTKYMLPKQLPYFLQPKYVPPDSPEAQMKLAIVACVLMPISLFWFAWTSGSNIHWIAPTLSGIPFAVSSMLIFISFVTYISQVYTIFTNSANACNSFMRSSASFALAIASHKIVSSLGVKWGVSLFGFLSLGLLAVPLIFLRYGEALRHKSHYAREANALVAQIGGSHGKSVALPAIPAAAYGAGKSQLSLPSDEEPESGSFREEKAMRRGETPDVRG